MPKIFRDPDSLRPYQFHGVDVNHAFGEVNVTSQCPFCGKEGKFAVRTDDGRFRCWSCNIGSEKGGGNATTFIRKLWELSDEMTDEYQQLVKSRGLLNPETLIRWEVCKSVTTDDWLVPGYGVDGKMNQLYRYVTVSGKLRLLPTPTLGHQLHGVNLYGKHCDTVFLCEGPWDAMALWEVLSFSKQSDGKLSVTASKKSSMLNGHSVLAVPGCEVFFERWGSLLADKNVVILFDSDHPKKNKVTGKTEKPAGYSALIRLCGKIGELDNLPKSLSYLHWGDQGYDPNRPSGYDIRDALRDSGNDQESRVKCLETLLARIRPVPKAWAGDLEPGKRRPVVEVKKCESYKVVTNSWRKSIKWTPGLDKAFSVMLAAVVSTKMLGDQLWIKIIGPASCGKTTLCEAISVSKKNVIAKSTIRGFHSGFGEGADGEDFSLISKVNGKTLVTKDGDTLLQSPNLSQILSEARDVYDTSSRTSYRNKASRDYEGIRMTWLLCGTSSLRSIDSSELGERFLDCVIMDGIDDDLEDDILGRVANRAQRSVGMVAGGKTASQQEPEMTLTMQLTGGYVDFLSENAEALLSSITMSDHAKRLCTRFGKFVAYMRARPSDRQDEIAEREFAARLVSQHVRLSMCLAAVLNKKTVDDDVISRTRAVCLDTSRGRTMDIASCLFEAGDDGVNPGSVAALIGESEDRCRRLLRFLRQIGAVETHSVKTVRGIAARPKWRLTERMKRLYSEVVGSGQD